MRNAIFWPLIAQVLLVAVVATRMYVIRIGEMRARRIRPQAMATSRTAAEALQNVAAADNFRNLFEVPVLFFAVCLALAVTDTVTRRCSWCSHGRTSGCGRSIASYTSPIIA